MTQTNLGSLLKTRYEKLVHAEDAAGAAQAAQGSEVAYLALLGEEARGFAPVRYRLSAARGLARLRARLGWRREAGEAYRTAVQASEERFRLAALGEDRASIAAEDADLFREYGDFLLGEGDTTGALAAFDSGRARTLALTVRLKPHGNQRTGGEARLPVLPGSLPAASSPPRA